MALRISRRRVSVWTGQDLQPTWPNGFFTCRPTPCSWAGPAANWSAPSSVSRVTPPTAWIVRCCGRSFERGTPGVDKASSGEGRSSDSAHRPAAPAALRSAPARTVDGIQKIITLLSQPRCNTTPTAGLDTYSTLEIRLIAERHRAHPLHHLDH